MGEADPDSDILEKLPDLEANVRTFLQTVQGRFSVYARLLGSEITDDATVRAAYRQASRIIFDAWAADRRPGATAGSP